MTPDFRKLWLAQSISFVGSEITRVALPLTAVLVLDADETDMGWLVAVERLPMVFFGLLAGVWVDRLRRRPLLIASDLARAALLLSIPVAAWAGGLTMAQLYAVAFGTGSFFILAAVAERAYLPSIVSKEQLVGGNARLMGSASFARTAGPGLAGVLVQVFSAPLAILLDVFSFLTAGWFVGSIRKPEPPAAPRGTVPTWAGMKEGLRRVWGSPLLRPLVLCGGTHNVCSTMIVAAYVLYVTRDLAVGPALLGVIFLAGGLGAIVGSVFAPRIADRVGVGPALIWSQVLTGVARLLIPLAGGPVAVVVGVLFASEFLLGVVRALFNVTQLSLRQWITPPEYQGRVNASVGFLLWFLTPFGALAGGYVGAAIGLRATLWWAGAGVLASTLCALPLRTYKRLA